MNAAKALRAALLAELEDTPLNPLEAADVLVDVLAAHSAAFNIPAEIVEFEFASRREVADEAVARAMVTLGQVH